MKKNLSISLKINIPIASGHQLIEISGVSKVVFHISNQLVDSNDVSDDRWRIIQPFVSDRSIEIRIEGEVFGQITDQILRKNALENKAISMQIIFENGEEMYGSFYVDSYLRRGSADHGETFIANMISSGAITTQLLNQYQAIEN